MSPAEVQEQAAAEGLVLQRSAKNATGFLNVKHIYTYDGRTNRRKPFAAQIYSDGRHTCLGNFATAEEAALAYARAINAVEAQEQNTTEGKTSSKRRRTSGAQHSDTDEASDGCQVVQVEVEAEAEDSEEEGAVLVDAVMVVAPHVSAQAQRRQSGASLMASLPQVPCSPIASRLAIRSGAPPPF